MRAIAKHFRFRAIRAGAVLLAVLAASSAFAAQIFVAGSDPKASDKNPGTEARPLKTIQKAASLADIDIPQQTAIASPARQLAHVVGRKACRRSRLQEPAARDTERATLHILGVTWESHHKSLYLEWRPRRQPTVRHRCSLTVYIRIGVVSSIVASDCVCSTGRSGRLVFPV